MPLCSRVDTAWIRSRPLPPLLPLRICIDQRADHALIGHAALLRFALEEVEAARDSESVTFTFSSRGTRSAGAGRKSGTTRTRPILPFVYLLVSALTIITIRHGRACPGHPRLTLCRVTKKVVDAREKRGHDGARVRAVDVPPTTNATAASGI